MDTVNMSLNGEKILALSTALCSALDTYLDSNKMTIEEVLVAVCHFKHRTTSSGRIPSGIMAAFDNIAESLPNELKLTQEPSKTVSRPKTSETLSIDDFCLIPSKHLH